MPFEKFIPPRRHRVPQVSIKRAGTIAFDNSYASTVGLAKASHALLFFDPARKLVGVKPTNDAKDEGALKISHRKRVCSVRARIFFDVYGITLERTSRFPVEYDQDSKLVVISLQELKRRRGPRKKHV
jgi:hypothetical protein